MMDKKGMTTMGKKHDGQMGEEERLSYINWKRSGTKLKNGWVISLINIEDERTRVQLMPPLLEIRKTIEAPSLEEALREAVEFSKMTEFEYANWLYGEEYG